MHDTDNPNAILWNPSTAPFDEAWQKLNVDDGVLAVVGGTDVFGLFLSIGYDAFFLTRTVASIPRGRPVFPGVGNDVPPEERLKVRPGAQEHAGARCPVSDDGGAGVGAEMSKQPTIARIWRGRVRRERADEYEKYNYDVGIKPLIEKALGVQTFREDRETESEFMTISYWEDDPGDGALHRQRSRRTSIISTAIRSF